MVAEIISKLFTVFVLWSGNVIRQEELRPATHIYTYRSCPSGLPRPRSRPHLHRLSDSPVLDELVEDVKRLETDDVLGVENTSLNSFQQEGEAFHSLRSYAYGRPLLEYWLTRRGTRTTLLDTKSPEEVISKAWELHKGDSFGEYNLFQNNCEHFATFCKTGVQVSTQTALIGAFELTVRVVKDWAIQILQGIELE
ncbi:hypothetical protein NL676_020391 [Syzygium grande]|nr:hypothetical protein NL676_020391 [Syzygium grande]